MNDTERDQLLALLAVKLAKIDANVSTIYTALFLTPAVQKKSGPSRDALAQELWNLREELAKGRSSVFLANIDHLKEQFPDLAHVIDETASINENDILSALREHQKKPDDPQASS